MKKRPWLILALCALFLMTGLLGACRAGSPVVGKVGKVNITQKNVDVYTNFILFTSGYTWKDMTNPQDMETLVNNALDNAVNLELLMQKGTQMGLVPLSEEDQKAVDDQASSYADQMSSAGLTAQDLTTLFTRIKVAKLIQEQMDKDITVTDADIQSKYDELSQQQKTDFDADASAYEAARDGGEAIVYVPAGFRYVKHILVALGTDDSSAVSNARSTGDTSGADKLRDDALAKIKSKADEVMAKVQSGEDFDALIEQYGEDPGMLSEPGKTTGYEIGSSSSFVQEFKDAAMKLAKVGDVSPLVGTDFGYHIIKYVSDVTPGVVALDKVKDAVQKAALDDKKNNNWNTTMDQWKKEIGVTTWPDRLNKTIPTPAPATASPAPAAT